MPPRGSNERNTWRMDLRQITVYEHFGWVNMWTKVHHVAWKSLVRIFSLPPKLSGLRRCILSQFLKFSWLKCFGGTPSQLWCALARLGQSVTRVKIWSGSTPPQGPKCSLPKMSAWVGQYEQLKRFCLWTKVQQFCCTQRARSCSW